MGPRKEAIVLIQQQGLWVTQERNGDVFAEAFCNCRHVVFVFSVNMSKAFQGYVSLPLLSLYLPLCDSTASLARALLPSSPRRFQWTKGETDHH